MRFVVAIVPILALAGATSAFADPVFDFKITGDGYTMQFSAANPPTVVEYPAGATDVSVTSLTGSLDGVSGYSYSAVLVAEGFYSPNFSLYVNPLPPSIVSPPVNQLGDFALNGPDLLTLVSDQPNPNPCGAFCPNDLLTFAFVPGDYTFYGYGPEAVRSGSYYTVDITQETSGVTPEPGSWALLLTGTGLAGGLQWRRRSASAAA